MSAKATQDYIISRARALGATSMLPADWNVGKSADTPKEPRTMIEPLVKAGMPTPATASNPDPDNDGDDDRTTAGDTDNSHFTASGTKKQTKKADAEPETISKAEYLQLETRLASIQKSLDDANKRALTAEAVAKAEQDARELNTAVAKAEKELPAIPGATSTELGKLMRDISKAVSAESYAKLEEVLKAANVALAKGDLFKEAGASVGKASGQTAFHRLQVVAKTLRDQDPTMTPAMSISKAMETQPDLVQEYRAESGFAR